MIRALLPLLALATLGCKSTPTSSREGPQVLEDSLQPCEASSDCSVTSIPAVATNCCPTCTVRPIHKEEVVELAKWCAEAEASGTCEQLDCSPSGSHRIKAACVRRHCVTVAVD